MPGPRIAIFAGPSGGHLFPALAYAESLKDRWPQSERFLVTSRRAENFVRHFEPGLFTGVEYLREFPFPSGFSLRSVQFLLEFPRAFMDSAKFLSKTKPDLCAGFGSFVSYPGMRLAAWKKIPNFIHEQNVVPGKATRMLAKHAGLVALSFENTFQGVSLKRVETTGLPVRRLLRDAAEKKPLQKSGPFKILVVGGSQGAHGLNRIIFDTFLRLSSEEKKIIAVTHITGQTDSDWVRQGYRENGIQAEVHAFYGKMQELYSEADMAITRAGANTLFELAVFKVPAIVVPYPFAGAHQADNAVYFEKRQALIQQAEVSLTPEWLLSRIRDLQKNMDQRKTLSLNISRLAPLHASEKLADWTEKLLGETPSGSHRQPFN